MSLDLYKRKKNFKNIFKNYNLKFSNNLIATGKIEKDKMKYIQDSSKLLLLSSLIGDKKKLNFNNLSFDEILDKIKKKRPLNITHNGLVVPKKETLLEYNLFLKSFYYFLNNSRLSRFIKYFIGPPQLRVKFLEQKKLTFNSSEYPHSDAWTKINTNKSITLFIPIYGDTKNNYVEFYLPKNNFTNKWLNKRYFSEGNDIFKKNYKKTKINYSIGQYIFADCSTLHKTTTKNKALPRVSIDIGIIPKDVKNFKKIKNHINKDVIQNVGFDKMFVFKNSITDKIKFHKEGSKTMLNREIFNYK